MNEETTDGQVAYDAYSRQAGGKSLVSGASLPVWADLPVPIKAAWETAAEAVIQREHARP